MSWKINVMTGQTYWEDDFSPPPQMGPQQSQSAGIANKLGGLAGTAGGGYLATNLFGPTAAAGAAAAPAGATIAGGSTLLGATSTPSALLPSLTSAAAPSAAAGIAPTAAAPAAGAGMGLGALASGAAAVAAPLIFGSMVDKMFFGQKPKRQFDVNEVIQDMPGQFNKLGTQVKNYENLSTEGRTKLINALHDSKLLALPGHAEIVDGQAITKERSPEYINWSRWLRDPRGGSEAANDRTSRWYNPVGKQPTEEEINSAHWLKDSKRQELLNALAAVKTAEDEANA